MITLNISNYRPINFNRCRINVSNPIDKNKFSNIAPLNKDTVSFTSRKKITFDDVNFESKFSEKDYDIVNKITTFAQKTGTGVYLVGGVVRDMLLGEDASDIDFLIEGDVVEFTRKFNEKYPETQIEYLNENYGIAKLRINESDIDLASTREESCIRKAIQYVKNIGCSKDKDIIRRDFTINSMALQLKNDWSGRVKFIPVDITGGLDDLNNGIISATYKDSFNDDPTRILRGLKFRLRYGFKYDEKTQKLQESYLANPPIEEISPARIDTALRKLFRDKKMAPLAFDAIIDEGLYKLFTPKLLAQSGWGAKIQKACKVFEIDFINDVVNIYIKLLDNETVSKAQELYVPDETQTDYDIYKKFMNFSNIELAIYYVATNDEDAVKFYTELKDKAPLLKRKNLVKMGYKKSEERRFLLDALLKAKLSNPNIITIEDEKRFIENILS